MALSQSELDSDKNGLSAGKTKAQSRVDTLNASIARCQAKLATTTGDAKDALLGLTLGRDPGKKWTCLNYNLIERPFHMLVCLSKAA